MCDLGSVTAPFSPEKRGQTPALWCCCAARAHTGVYARVTAPYGGRGRSPSPQGQAHGTPRRGDAPDGGQDMAERKDGERRRGSRGPSGASLGDGVQAEPRRRHQQGARAGGEAEPGTHLLRPSGCTVAQAGRAGALPNCRRRGCLGCRRLMRPSLTGSQSRLGMSSWLGSRQHSSTSASSGSLVGPSSRPAGRGPWGRRTGRPCPERCLPGAGHRGLLGARSSGPGLRPQLYPDLPSVRTHLFV